MHPKQILTIILVFLLSPEIFSQISDIPILRDNLIRDALENHGFSPRTGRYIESDFSQVGAYLGCMQADGSWPEVDYADRDNNWSPLMHLNKMLVMTIGYAKSTSKWYQKKALLEGLERSIHYWYKVNPVCDNWYKNRIAKQFYFNVMALLLQGKIDDSLHANMVNDLTGNPTMTGSNRTLLAISTFYRGVIENNPERVKLGVSGVTDQIVVTDKEGIQPDYSFHQHGPFIYNGSYGSNFLRESIWMATMVHGTKFAFSASQIRTLRDYFLEGTRWMLRGNLFDYNVRGRQVGRDSGLLPHADVILPQLDHFMIADPEFKEEYESAQRHIENKTPQEVRGNRHFWRSDYTAHHRPAYFTSLKMCSKRTVGIELDMNSENKLGYWLPYGLTYIYRRGDEYTGIFPVWDWALLPGVTCPHVEILKYERNESRTQQTDFVGGVSDGRYGVSAMDFYKQDTRAKKAWFWFDDEWVALGAGITSDHNASIVTGINQSLLCGDVFIDGKPIHKGSQSLVNPRWVWHDSTGYIFPDDGRVCVRADVQEGNIQRMYGLGKDTVYAWEVFSLWFDHGLQPQYQSYQYIVVPGIDAEDLAACASDLPITLLSNTEKVQAVSHDRLCITGVVFHQAGEFAIGNDLTVGLDKPGLVLLNLNKGMINLCDPTSIFEEITLTLKKGNGNVQSKTVKLPAGIYAGKSVSVKMDLLSNGHP
jgi:chondroitin AC lyase